MKTTERPTTATVQTGTGLFKANFKCAFSSCGEKEGPAHSFVLLVQAALPFAV